MTRLRSSSTAALVVVAALSLAILPASVAFGAGSIGATATTRILVPVAGGNFPSAEPWAVALSPDETILYATSFLSGDVTTIEVATGTSTTVSSDADGAYSIGMAPDGTVLVGASVTGELFAFTPVGGVYSTATLSTGGNPRGIAVAFDGTVYAADRAMNTITVTDSTLASSTTFPAAPSPLGLAISPDGSVLAVTKGDSTVEFFTPAGTSLGVVASADDPWFVTFSPDGSTAWVASYGGDTVTPISVATLTAGTPIIVGPGPAELRVSPDGRWLYVMVDTGGDYVVVDTVNGTVASSMPATTPFPFSLTMRADGSRLYSGSGGLNDIVALDPADLVLSFTAPDRIDPGTAEVSVATALDDGLPVDGDYSGGALTLELLDATSTVVASTSGADSPDPATGLAELTLPTAALPAGTYTMRVTWTTGTTTLVAEASGFRIAAVLPPTGAQIAGAATLAALFLGLGVFLLGAVRATGGRRRRGSTA